MTTYNNDIMFSSICDKEMLLMIIRRGLYYFNVVNLNVNKAYDTDMILIFGTPLIVQITQQ